MNRYLKEAHIHFLKSKCTFKRGRIVLSELDIIDAKRALNHIWNGIADDVCHLYENDKSLSKFGGYPPQSHIREMVLDSGRPETEGLDYLLGGDLVMKRAKGPECLNKPLNQLSPALEYLFSETL